MSEKDRRDEFWNVVLAGYSLGISGVLIWYEYARQERLERAERLLGGVTGESDGT